MLSSVDTSLALMASSLGATAGAGVGAGADTGVGAEMAGAGSSSTSLIMWGYDIFSENCDPQLSDLYFQSAFSNEYSKQYLYSADASSKL